MQEIEESETDYLRRATVCGFAVLASFALIFLLSKPFEYRSGLARPIWLVVGTLMFASVAAFVGLVNAVKVPKRQRKYLLLVIVGLAVSTRIVALFTCPILEIDYYRYLWDGKVLAQSVSPYQFSPADVLSAEPAFEVLPKSEALLENESARSTSEAETRREANLQSLVLLSTQSESNYTILTRIHYAKYTTVYPPVSQFVFGLTMKWFPVGASVEAHIVAIKFVLVLFDLATMAVIFWILCSLKFHPGWIILYAWNPLVIKEIANGGHLDSIATFFLTLAVFAIVRFRISESASSRHVILGGVALGIGVGAKLAPAVLFPALAVMVARRSPAKAVVFCITCFAAVVLSLWPMLGSNRNSGEKDLRLQSTQVEAQGENRVADNSPIRAAKNKDGLVAFFSKWRMNDPIFSTVYLNLKNQNRKAENHPWFVFTSKKWRGEFCDWMRAKKLGGKNPAFFTARGLTLSAFSVFYLWQLVLLFRADGDTTSGGPDDSNSRQAVAKSLSRLAWIMSSFLVLQPTVNPWYFVWVAPLTCVTRNKAWVLVSGILMIYYARFWFRSLPDSNDFFGCTYSGAGLFDHLIVFAEFGLISLLLVYFGRRSYHNV